MDEGRLVAGIIEMSMMKMKNGTLMKQTRNRVAAWLSR